MSMAVSRESLTCLCIWVVVSSLGSVSSTSLPVCPLRSWPVLDHLHSECPISFLPIPALEVNGDFLERSLTYEWGNMYTAVLFYASWCPFSHDVRLTFEALSSMFPQIEHLAVEQSSVTPSVLSQNGIHSFPAILMANQTSRGRFLGSKDLHSLVKLYKKITGYEPLHHVSTKQFTSLESSRKFVIQSWNKSEGSGMLRREPYLLFSMMFLCIRILVFLLPEALSRFRAFWVSYAPQLNLEIFGETSQILGCVLHMTDLEQIWAKLRFWKIRNLREGAKSAQVWASSLASSVS